MTFLKKKVHSPCYQVIFEELFLVSCQCCAMIILTILPQSFSKQWKCYRSLVCCCSCIVVMNGCTCHCVWENVSVWECVNVRMCESIWVWQYVRECVCGWCYFSLGQISRYRVIGSIYQTFLLVHLICPYILLIPFSVFVLQQQCSNNLSTLISTDFNNVQ